MEWIVPLTDVRLTHEDKIAVNRVLDSGWLTMGRETEAFEKAFHTFTGIPHAVAVTNCTAALHLSLHVLGIGPGDEVICPALNFSAGPNVIVQNGARVVFADITSQDDLCISPDDVEKKITPKTRAIMVMHYGGYPCDMEVLKQIAGTYGLAIIEDAAHALDAWLNGTHCGGMSEVGCFSFYSNKNMTTGEGGMVTTRDPELEKKLRLLRSHGMTTPTMHRHQGKGFSYDIETPGFNFRIDEMRAALGRSQLQQLALTNSDRKKLAGRYRESLKETPIKLPFTDTRGKSSHHIQPLILPQGRDRNKFMNAMKEKGIQTSIHYPPVHLFSWYRQHYPKICLPVTESIAQRLVTLPLYAGMGETKVDFVCEAVADYFKESN